MIPKFRAWDKETKTMIEVSLINFEEHLILGGYWEFGQTESIKFDEIELMQSTGLKDKNGKEVFVGDIIKCTRGCPHEVSLVKEYGGTYIGGMPAIYLKGIREGYAWTEHEEILGNVYENPELLED